jgi:uncharacterized Tic20 family protein
MKKDSVRGASELGRRVLNFQITWTFLTFTFFILYMLMIGIFRQFAGAMIFIVLFFSMYLLNTLLVIISSIQIKHGKENVYGYAINIIR